MNDDEPEGLDWNAIAARGNVDQPCPHCNGTITFNVQGTETVDILHTQPPCEDFRAFVERLFAAHRKGTN